MPVFHRARIVVDALRLRRWAIDVFAGRVSEPPQCRSDAWRLFAATERCTARLRQELKVRGQSETRPPAAHRALEGAALVEIQRALAARGQAAEVASIAAGNGWRVIVLKGGAAAAAGRAEIDLHDLDLLVEPSHARELADALRTRGYASSGWSSPQHLTPLSAPDQLPIELHVSLDPFGATISPGVWHRAQPIEGTPSLERLAPVDQLWHLLVHIGVQHPDRYGALRDLLLMRDAREQCSPDALDDLAARIRSHDHKVVFRRLLEASTFGCDGLNDPFVRDRAQVLVTGALTARLPAPAGFRGVTADWALALLQGAPAFHYRWYRVRMRTVEASATRPIAWVERRSSHLGRGVRVASRVLRHGAAFVVALPLAAAAWWLVRGVLRELGAERVAQELGQPGAAERVQAESEVEARPARGSGE